jgi:hypothetical protein
MKEEIKSSDWKTLCERLNDLEAGQLVTLIAVDHAGAQREIERAAELKSIEFRQVSGCNDAVIIRAGGVDHQAVDPLHIRLVQNAGGGFNPVEIDAEEGSVVLQFKPALKPAILEGLGRVGWAGAAR